VFALFLKRRKGYETEISKWKKRRALRKEDKVSKYLAKYKDKADEKSFAAVAHNVPLVAIGTALLWFGWQGFNGGSALKSGSWASAVWVNTNLAAAAAALGWMMMDMINTGKPTLVGACNGAVAGLVAITPAAGYIQVPISVLCGFSSAIIIFWVVKLKAKVMDDSLDAFAIHGVGGMYGCVFTGVFASSAFVKAVAGAK
jgi:Amt family ammonium transporter